MSTNSVVIGDVEIQRVVEWEGPFAPMPALFPGVTQQQLEGNRSWLTPDFWEPESNLYVAAMNTWVIRSSGRTIVVDTGIGNDKYRPYAPPMNYLDTDFLAKLEAVGVLPEDVDVVVNTHVHADHVGWNTRLVDRQWVPTFPNAEYLINAADAAFWNPLNGHRPQAVFAGLSADRGNQNMFEDSVAPIQQAGQAVLWDTSHTIDENLRLDLQAGHTAGSGILTLSSRGESAVFVGDMLHSPLQILHPDMHACLDEDPRQASASRRRVLEWAADHTALVLPAHFPGSPAVEIARDGSEFTISAWRAFGD